jgi:hypothetical protein
LGWEVAEPVPNLLEAVNEPVAAFLYEDDVGLVTTRLSGGSLGSSERNATTGEYEDGSPGQRKSYRGVSDRRTVDFGMYATVGGARHRAGGRSRGAGLTLSRRRPCSHCSSQPSKRR